MADAFIQFSSGDSTLTQWVSKENFVEVQVRPARALEGQWHAFNLHVSVSRAVTGPGVRGLYPLAKFAGSKFAGSN